MLNFFELLTSLLLLNRLFLSLLGQGFFYLKLKFANVLFVELFVSFQLFNRRR